MRVSRYDEEHPVGAGVRAVLIAAVVVGAVLGVGALVGLGVSGAVNMGHSKGNDTLVMPSFTPEKHPAQPVVLPSSQPKPVDSGTSPTPVSTPSNSPIPQPTGKYPINLQAGETNVMTLLDLSGTYAAGEGDTVQVQQLVSGAWQDVTAAGQSGKFVVTGQLFSGSIQPSGKGQQSFRVRSTTTDAVSNPVTVTVG